MPRSYQVLDDAMVKHFMEKGYVRVPNAFTREQAADWTKNMWTRLGFEPENQETWTREWTNMPHFRSVLVRDFAPRAWGAICDLVGGEDRIDPERMVWNDSLIVNLGLPEYLEQDPPPPRTLANWHCDGDFFLHFLDSREQALLVVPLFTDIKPLGGATLIAPDAVGKIARHLRDHPEGVLPKRPPLEPGATDGFNVPPVAFPWPQIAEECNEFVELTGEIGDVVLMHPLMLHTRSQNHLRIPRVITNPPVSLQEPFNFDRSNADDYSVVELKTLRELDVDPYNGPNKTLNYRRTGERRALIPERIARQAKWKAEAEERLKAQSSVEAS